MLLRTSCDLAFDITVPTPFILMLRPRSGAQQWVAKEEYRIKPSVPVFEFTDNYGNLCQRLIAPSGTFSVHTSAEVVTADQIDQGFGAPFVEIQNLPDAVLSFLLPSRYCESDRFNQMAGEITAGQQLATTRSRQSLLGCAIPSVIAPAAVTLLSRRQRSIPGKKGSAVTWRTWGLRCVVA